MQRVGLRVELSGRALPAWARSWVNPVLQNQHISLPGLAFNDVCLKRLKLCLFFKELNSE